MKPLLSLDMLLGGAGGQPLPQHGPSADDDLEHRIVQIVWANGETLETPVPTRGSALLQHGFKEWSGARGVVQMAGDRSSGGDTADALWPLLQDCEDNNWMPLVLCRGLAEPLRVLARMRGDGDCALLALGKPSGYTMAAAADLCAAAFPVRIEGGVEPGRCIWLGAPRGLPAPPPGLRLGVRLPARKLDTRSMPRHLQCVEQQLWQMGPSRLWCLVFLDDVELPGSGPDGGELAAEAVAATLRWLQRRLPWTVVFLVSHERVSPAQRGAVADLARQLGRALHRHPGIEREAFPQR